MSEPAVEVARQFLRSKGLVETGDVVRVVEDDDECGTLHQLCIDESPEVAAHLTWMLIGELIDRGLDRTGVSVCYLGMKMGPSQP